MILLQLIDLYSLIILSAVVIAWIRAPLNHPIVQLIHTIDRFTSDSDTQTPVTGWWAGFLSDRSSLSPSDYLQSYYRRNFVALIP